MKVFFIIKHNSERVKNKNFKKICNVELYKKALYNFRDFEVFVDTDSDKIISECRKDRKLQHVFCYKRKKEFISMEKRKTISPAPYLIKNFLENYIQKKNEIVITSHVTSPFVSIRTIKDALKKMKNFDSVSSCRMTQDFCYLEGKKVNPVNFNPKIIQKTQSLKKIIHLNGAFFIIKKNIFLSNGLNRISDNHFFYKLKFPEYIDIDNYEDLDLSRKISDLF